MEHTLEPVSSARESVPKWERGRLVSFGMDSPAVWARDNRGQLSVNSTVWPLNSSRVKLQDISVSPSVGYAVTGTGFSADGAVASFIAWLESTGHPTRMLEISPPAAFKISFADDGTLWALVRAHDSHSEEIPQYDMLRQYDGSGNLIRTALPRSHFKTKHFPAVMGSLTISGSKVGVYADGPQIWGITYLTKFRLADRLASA